MKLDPENLPYDLEFLQQLVRDLLRELVTKDQALEKVVHQLSVLRRCVFGQRSEKIDPQQARLEFLELLRLLPGGAILAEPVGDTPTPSPEPAKPVKKKRKGHGRNKLPSSLPRRETLYVLSKDQCQCKKCGRSLREFGRDAASQLEYKPASLFVHTHVEVKYTCDNCKTVVTSRYRRDGAADDPAPDASGPITPAPTTEPATEGVAPTASSTEAATPNDTATIVEGPRPAPPIDKGLAGPGLLAYVLTSKYADHLPLYRLEGILARSGVNIARSTMCGWIAGCAQLLLPLWALMKTRVLLSLVLHTDDTTVPVLDRTRDKTRKANAWVYYGDAANPYVVLDYTTSRKRDGPASFLQTFEGYLQADGYGGYDGVYAGGRVREVACWAHARRKIYDARSTDEYVAKRALTYIRLLYDIEELARVLTQQRQLSLEEMYALRMQLRREYSRPRIEQLRQWLDGEVRARTLPRSVMGEAIGYVRNQWEALLRYLDDGRLSIDNNVSEREMKAVAVGRKNWMFFGSDDGGRNAVIVMSFVRTCRRHGIDPQAYLCDVLARLPMQPVERLADLLPDAWRLQADGNDPAALAPPQAA